MKGIKTGRFPYGLWVVLLQSALYGSRHQVSDVEQMGNVAILFCDNLERIITAKPLYIISEGTEKNMEKQLMCRIHERTKMKITLFPLRHTKVIYKYWYENHRLPHKSVTDNCLLETLRFRYNSPTSNLECFSECNWNTGMNITLFHRNL